MQLSRNIVPNPLILHPRENLIKTGNFGALNAEIIIECDSCSSLALDLRGTFSLTIEISGTVDDTNWVVIPTKPFLNGNYGRYTASVVGTLQGGWVAPLPPFRRIRARCTSFTSGTAIVTLLASNSTLPNDALDSTTDIATILGTVSAATTLTIASPGAGLRHYITYFQVSRFAAALLTAAAVPVNCTTTNLPGAFVLSFPADAAPQGSLLSAQENFSYPVSTAAQNVATTIACPATPNVIWRITAGYQIRP